MNFIRNCFLSALLGFLTLYGATASAQSAPCAGFNINSCYGQTKVECGMFWMFFGGTEANQCVWDGSACSLSGALCIPDLAAVNYCPVPPGSYKTYCDDLAMSGTTLTAYCGPTSDPNDQLTYAALSYACTCPNDIAWVKNAYLACQ